MNAQMTDYVDNFLDGQRPLGAAIARQQQIPLDYCCCAACGNEFMYLRMPEGSPDQCPFCGYAGISKGMFCGKRFVEVTAIGAAAGGGG